MTAPANDRGQATRRIMRLVASATAEELDHGLAWYGRAHAWAAEVGERHNLAVTRVAGIVAALSPQTDWPLNKRKALDLIEHGDTFGLGRGRGQARAILAGADPDEVLTGPKVRAFWRTITDPATSDEVVIDRHAVDAAVGMVTDDRTRKAILERKGGYDHVAAIYRSAAEALGLRPHVVQAIVWAVWRNRFARRLPEERAA